MQESSEYLMTLNLSPELQNMAEPGILAGVRVGSVDSLLCHCGLTSSAPYTPYPLKNRAAHQYNDSHSEFPRYTYVITFLYQTGLYVLLINRWKCLVIRRRCPSKL